MSGINAMEKPAHMFGARAVSGGLAAALVLHAAVFPYAGEVFHLSLMRHGSLSVEMSEDANIE